jgi:hypothetical protein
MTNPTHETERRKALAVRIRETVSDFGPLMEWAKEHEQTLLRDMVGTDPQAHGRLASFQGALAELQKWKTLDRWVCNLADKPD